MNLALAFEFSDLAYLALSIFLLAVGLGLGYAFVRLGGTLGRLSAFIQGTQEELLPVIHKVGGTVDRVNTQLDKVDRVTDSAVDAADSADTAVRAVSFAIGESRSRKRLRPRRGGSTCGRESSHHN